MTRLPTPGQDDNTWGQLLNDYLSVSHNADGSLKLTALPLDTDGSFAANSDSKLATQKATKTYVDNTVSAGAPLASNSTPGLVQLTNDLGGSATSPTVTGLHLSSALPVNQGGTGSATQNFVDLSTNQTIIGTKTFNSTITGSISGNAATVTTNANLVGPITSIGNTSGVASQTGTGSTFVMSASPVLTGNPAAPTAIGGTNTTQIATTAFVASAAPTPATFTTSGLVKQAAYNVRDYGAVGDGVTDDRAAIQAAINAAAVNGGIVYFSAAVYKVVAVTVTGVPSFACGLFAKSNVTLLGADKIGAALLFSGSTGRTDGINIGYIDQASNSTANVSNFSIRNLTLDGNGISLTSFGSAVRQNTTVNFTKLMFEDLIIQNWALLGGIGIGLTGGGASKYVTCKNIYGTNILRAVIWFASVDYLSIDQITGESIVGDSGTDEGCVVEVESGKHPMITNIVGVDTPYQTLLLGGTTRGVVHGVCGTFNKDGIYVEGSDWHISDVRLEVSSSPASTTCVIRYDKTNTPGHPNGSPVENSNYYIQFSDVWSSGANYGIYINASATHPSDGFQFDRIKFEGMTTAAVNLTYATNVTFNELETLSNAAVFQLNNSTVQVLGGYSSESGGAYTNSLTSSTLIIHNVYGQADSPVVALDSAVVHTTGNETIAGNKLFTGSITSNNKVAVNGVGTPVIDLQTNQSGTKEFLLAVGLLNANSFSIYDQTTGSYRLHIDTNGLIGLGGQTSPTAALQLPASTTGVASLRIPSGTAPTSPNSGEIWFDGSHLQFRNGSTTDQIDSQSGSFNLTGPITSAGVATSIASQTGTGSTFAMSAAPTFTGTANFSTIAASNSITSNNKLVVNGIGTAIVDLQTNQTGNKEFLLAVGLSSATSFDIYDQSAGHSRLNIDTNGNITINGNLTLPDAGNISLGTTTGTKVGTATNQKLGFYNAAPVVQQTTTGTSTGFTAGSGTGFTSTSTSTGGIGSTAYTYGDLVLALKNLGLLAQ